MITMPFYRASFRHTFSTGDTVELTSSPYPWPMHLVMWMCGLLSRTDIAMAELPYTPCSPVLNDRAPGTSHNQWAPQHYRSPPTHGQHRSRRAVRQLRGNPLRRGLWRWSLSFPERGERQTILGLKTKSNHCIVSDYGYA